MNYIDIVVRLGAKLKPSNLDDNSRRDFTYKLAQTLKAMEPGKNWGTKRYLDGPQSSDVVCVAGTGKGYDTMTGRGNDPTVIYQWNEIDLDGNNIFIPVEAHNWLEEEQHADVPHDDAPHDDAPPVNTDDEIITRIADAIAAQVKAAITEALKDIEFPVYEATVNFPFVGKQKLTLTPRK